MFIPLDIDLQFTLLQIYFMDGKITKNNNFKVFFLVILFNFPNLIIPSKIIFKECQIWKKKKSFTSRGFGVLICRHTKWNTVENESKWTRLYLFEIDNEPTYIFHICVFDQYWSMNIDEFIEMNSMFVTFSKFTWTILFINSFNFSSEIQIRQKNMEFIFIFSDMMWGVYSQQQSNHYQMSLKKKLKFFGRWNLSSFGKDFLRFWVLRFGKDFHQNSTFPIWERFFFQISTSQLLKRS